MGQRAPADSILQALNRRRGQLLTVDGLFLDYQLALHSRDYRGLRDYDGALKAMRQVVEIAPGSEFLLLAGLAARGDGRLPEAIEFFTQAGPDDGWLGGQASYLLTWTYHRLGDHERELEALSRLRQLDPESHRILRAGMRALAASGRIGGTWTVEFKRKLDTGHDDDKDFTFAKSVSFAVATYENDDGSGHRVSRAMTLHFKK